MDRARERGGRGTPRDDATLEAGACCSEPHQCGDADGTWRRCYRAIYQVYDSNGNQIANQSFSVDQAGCNCSMPQGFSCTGYQPATSRPLTLSGWLSLGLETGRVRHFPPERAPLTMVRTDIWFRRAPHRVVSR
jgi:hypothetical protein